MYSNRYKLGAWCLFIDDRIFVSTPYTEIIYKIVQFPTKADMRIHAVMYECRWQIKSIKPI